MVRLRDIGSALGLSGSHGRRTRLQDDLDDAAIYAIGDVHGCHAQLMALEDRIKADSEAFPGRKVIVMLGDFVDRGPGSANVLQHLIQPPMPGFERICLAGNHDLAMLAFCEGRLPRTKWLAMGGLPALLSYGLDPDHLDRVYGSKSRCDKFLRTSIPAEHVRFLKDLPILLQTPRYVFVHAGLRPGISLERQSDEDLVSFRPGAGDASPVPDRLVIHGHTPIATPRIERHRLNLDTGACYNGRLVAFRVWKTRAKFLST